MAPLTTYLLPAMVAVTAVRAVDLPSLVPKCAPPCLYEAVDENSTCEKDEDACICRDIYSIKRHSESCLEDKCSDIEYGECTLVVAACQPCRTAHMYSREMLTVLRRRHAWIRQLLQGCRGWWTNIRHRHRRRANYRAGYHNRGVCAHERGAMAH